MVSGMATAKITVTIPLEQLDAIRALVKTGEAASTSAFVAHAVGLAPHDTAEWRQMLAEALEETGGPLTNPERAWADAILS